MHGCSGVYKFFNYSNKFAFLDGAVSVRVQTSKKVPDLLFRGRSGFTEFIVDVFHELCNFFDFKRAGVVFVVLLVDHVNHGVKFLLGDFAHKRR